MASWCACWTLTLSRHFVTWCAGAVTRVNTAGPKSSLWTGWQWTRRKDSCQCRTMKTNTNKPKACKNQAVHLDRSSPHEHLEGIFVGTLRSRGDTTLLRDRHTSSHSRLHKCLACILKTMWKVGEESGNYQYITGLPVQSVLNIFYSDNSWMQSEAWSANHFIYGQCGLM